MQYPMIAQPQFAFAPSFAGGGLADAAQTLRSRGRGDDTMLVHMTPGEVGGLQALAMAHGGSLTTNPNTGLPEAGFLKKLLPTLIGVGLGAMGVPPIWAGLGAGAFETLRTGDLGKGLMTGLGVFSGSGIGSSLVGPNSFGAEMAGQQFAGQQLASQALPQATLEGITLPENYGQLAVRTTAPAEVAALGRPGVEQFAQQGMLGQAADSISAIGQPGGLSGYSANLMKQYGGPVGSAVAAIPTISSVSEMVGRPRAAFPVTPTATSFNYAGPYVPAERTVRRKPTEDTSTSEFSYFTPSNPVPGYQAAASGGLMGSPDDDNEEINEMASGGLAELEKIFVIPDGLERAGFEVPDGLFERLRFEVPSFPTGLARLEQPIRSGAVRTASEFSAARGGAVPRFTYAGGKFLRGPGDGTSDSIPAVIGSKQPARLADGEFVVDARTVAELGNGSSNAGAKKLYAMMERVHSARKKAKRGKDSNADRYLPA